MEDEWRAVGNDLERGQSAIAGAFFIAQALKPDEPSIANVAGYAGLGAFYFLISAVWLTVSHIRKKTA